MNEKPPKPPAPTSPHDPQRKTVLNLYAALAVSMILGFAPHLLLAIVAALFLLGVLIAAYITRKKAGVDSLLDNHATYIIRTIWIGGLLAVITTTFGGIVLINDIDYSDFDPCAQALMGQAETLATNPNYNDIWQHTNPCMDAFLATNKNGLIIAGIISILPIAFYFALRFVRGLSRAIKGYRIANPKMWL